MFPPRFTALLLALLLAAAPLHAHEAAVEMAAAANNLLATFTPEQKQKASFDYPEEERKNWHFIPRVRKGLPLKELTYEQRLLAHGLLATGLSGWLFTTDRFWGAEWLETLHGALGQALLPLLLLHVAGVVFTSFRQRENLVAAMLDGRKCALPDDEAA